MARKAQPNPAFHDPKKKQLLEAAVGVFGRYGFRKTSMDEVARAAGISRQGLYLHFPTKEELFHAMVLHFVASNLDAVNAALDEEKAPLEARVVRAFDAWVGRYLGLVGADASDLMEATLAATVKPLLAEYEERFTDALAKAFRGAGLAVAYKPAGVTARQLAETLSATARGLKHAGGPVTREQFLERLTVAVKALSLPLRKS
jgi:AcrR family transcriptional regulator